MTSSILQVNELRKSFGGVRALDRVSFNVPANTVVGVIGPNGSGKSTLVNTITGFVAPDAGVIRFKGWDIARRPAHAIARLGIARTFQTARPFHQLAAFENVVVPLFSGRSRELALGRWGDRNGVAMDLLEEVGFERDSAIPYKPAGSLPQGYLRRLELARCLALRAELIITDELFSGLSTAEVSSLLPLIDKLIEEGVTLMMIEHRLKDLFRIAGRVIAMDRGRIIAQGSPQSVMEDEEVRASYIGVGPSGVS